MLFGEDSNAMLDTMTDNVAMCCESDNIDEICSSMSDIQLFNLEPECVICKNHSKEKIINTCTKNCIYDCHMSCLNEWIMCKRTDISCIICNAPCTIEFIKYINNLISNQSY